MAILCSLTCLYQTLLPVPIVEICSHFPAFAENVTLSDLDVSSLWQGIDIPYQDTGIQQRQAFMIGRMFRTTESDWLKDA